MEPSTALYNLDKDQLTETANLVKAKLKELGLDELDFRQTRRLFFDDPLRKRSQIVFDQLVSPAVKAKEDQLSEELEKMLGSYGPESYNVNLQVGLGYHQKFPRLENLNVVPSKESGRKFECPPGEVVVIIFWATSCPSSQSSMQQNQDILEKNEENWKGKARIVGVSVDDDIEEVIKMVEEKKWGKIEHYHVPGGLGSPAIAQFDLEGSIPRMFRVGKKGIVKFMGSPDNINLEYEINVLIAKNKDTSAKSKSEPKLSIAKELEMFKSIEEKYEAHKNLIKRASGLSTQLLSVRTWKGTGGETFSCWLDYYGVVTSKQNASILEFHKNVIQPFIENIYFLNSLQIKDTPEIKYGSACATCKKQLGKGASHYVCTACQYEGKENHAFCLECADKELTQEINSGNDLFHQHGLLLVYENSDEALESLKRIMNRAEIIPDDDPDFEQVKTEKVFRGVSCNGCGEDIKNHKWACANCYNFDYCNDCFKASRDPNQENYKEITEKAQDRSHDKSHIFYRSSYLMRISD